MKIRNILGCTFVIALLTSCSGNDASKDYALEVRDHYRALKSLVLQADLTADLDDRVAEFSLIYTEIEGSGSEITVLSPESISNVKARFSPEGAKLIYDGAVLELGAMPNTELSPISSLPAMLGAWRDGYLTEQNVEEMDGVKCAALSWTATHAGQQLSHRAWFDLESYAPVRAEISCEGKVIISCIFKK